MPYVSGHDLLLTVTGRCSSCTYSVPFMAPARTRIDLSRVDVSASAVCNKVSMESAHTTHVGSSQYAGVDVAVGSEQSEIISARRASTETRIFFSSQQQDAVCRLDSPSSSLSALKHSFVDRVFDHEVGELSDVSARFENGVRRERSALDFEHLFCDYEVCSPERQEVLLDGASVGSEVVKTANAAVYIECRCDKEAACHDRIKQLSKASRVMLKQRVLSCRCSLCVRQRHGGHNGRVMNVTT